MFENGVIAASESRYRAVIEQMADSFYVMGAVRDGDGEIRDFRVLECNETATRRLNRDRTQVVGQLYSIVYPRARQTGMIARLAHVTTSREVFDGELAIDVPGGEKRHLWVRIMPITDGVAIISTDITAQKRLEDEHEGFFRIVPDMLCVAGFDGYFKRLNPAWHEALGWSLEELTSRPFVDFVHPEDRARTIAETAKLIAGMATLSFDNRYRHKNGGYRMLAWRAAPAKSLDVIFATARDVTDLVRTAEELVASKEHLARTERLASLGALAAGMGHEINNPLLAVLSNLGFAEEAAQVALRTLADGNVDQPVVEQAIAQLRVLRDALADAGMGADRVRTIVQDLRRFARTESVASQTLKLPAVLEAALQIAAPELGDLRVIRQLGATPEVNADASKLAQVFAHLLVNAAQALLDRSERNEIRIRTSSDASGSAVIEVIDTGVGIAPEVVQHVFDPFFTTKRNGEDMGLGLGLAICHSHVAMFGGEIDVISTPGKGSTFRVVLPAARAAVKTQTIRLPLIKPETRARILVIDDEEIVGRSLQRILSKMHDVEIATEGAAALAMIARGRYDMILCDIMMPNMSGVDIFENVSRANPEQASRMVFMTGGAFTVRTQQFLSTTTNPHVLKPFSAETIRSIAATVIAGGTVST